MACAGRERLKPAVDQAASQVEPMTKDVTSGVIRPGGEQLSKNAVPMTKEIAENRVQPAVEQVSTLKKLACGRRGLPLVSNIYLLGWCCCFWCREHSMSQAQPSLTDLRSAVPIPVWLRI